MLASQLLLSSWNKHCSLNTASLDIIVIWLWTNEGSRAGSANERPGVADQLSSHCVLLLLSDNKLSVNQHHLLLRESTLSPFLPPVQWVSEVSLISCLAAGSILLWNLGLGGDSPPLRWQWFCEYRWSFVFLGFTFILSLTVSVSLVNNGFV